MNDLEIRIDNQTQGFTLPLTSDEIYDTYFRNVNFSSELDLLSKSLVRIERKLSVARSNENTPEILKHETTLNENIYERSNITNQQMAFGSFVGIKSDEFFYDSELIKFYKQVFFSILDVRDERTRTAQYRETGLIGVLSSRLDILPNGLSSNLSYIMATSGPFNPYDEFNTFNGEFTKYILFNSQRADTNVISEDDVLIVLDLSKGIKTNSKYKCSNEVDMELPEYSIIISKDYIDYYFRGHRIRVPFKEMEISEDGFVYFEDGHTLGEVMFLPLDINLERFYNRDDNSFFSQVLIEVA